ncbi:hypothetical protein BKA62DRAFT_703031 [Auriculariales sp. MPI-PUGE-AT-0066]|nr:hypothetical protein BKA62DRAFT_703031 [Auriculariales sp. MPI-PUGE-AT-0066]
MATSLFTVQALRQVGSLTGVPAIQAILGTASLIFESAKVARRNRLACLRVVQLVNETLELVQSELKDANMNELSDEAINSLERLNKALQSVLEFVEHQSQPGMARLLQDQTTRERQAREELSRALSAFLAECAINLHRQVNQLQEQRTKMQIQTLSILDATAGTASEFPEDLRTRSLPSAGLLVGRDTEQGAILDQLRAASTSSPARVIILGGGGMGKSTLALSILNHPIVVEDATSTGALIAEIASQLGIAGDQLRKRLLSALRSTTIFIVLDNFETPWEVADQRVDTERFLGEISSLPNVTLIVTMRGSERPMGTTWTTPTLEPLGALDLEASRQIFSTIAYASGGDDSAVLKQFLGLLDGIPLAVTLAANMACSESVEVLLQRWQEEGTKALHAERSGASSRLSSLDVSIKLSVESSRIIDSPGAFELLQLLALLPNGVPEGYSHPAFKSSALLAYPGEDGRLRSLSPIRLYVLHHHPPPYPLIAPLEQEYASLTIVIRKLGSSLVCGYCLDNVTDVAWPISVVTEFEGMLYFTGMPESPHLARVSASPVASPRQQVDIILRQIRRVPNKVEEAALARKAVDMTKDLGDVAMIVEAEYYLAVAIMTAEGANMLRRVLSGFQQLGDDYLVHQGRCWDHLSNKALMTDNFSQSLQYGTKAVACFEAADHITGAISARINMTHNYLRRGAVRKAEAIARECLGLCLSIDSAAPIKRVYESLSFILLTAGKLTEALRMNELARQFNQRYGSVATLAFQTEVQSDILVNMGNIIAARAVFDAAGRLHPNRSPWQQLVRTLHEASLAHVEGNFAEVDTLAVTGFELARRVKSTQTEVNMHHFVIETALDRAKEAEDAGFHALTCLHATAALHRSILCLALCSRDRNMLLLVTCIWLLGRSLAAMKLHSDAGSVLAWGVEWAAHAEFRIDHARMLVALAHLADETTAISAERRVAWETALEASRRAEMSGLVAECEAYLV